MKYKALKSVAHNFSHSFVSSMNYVDGDHVIDDLRHLARKAGGGRIRINWLPDSPPPPHLTPRVLKSIGYYKAWLPDFLRKSGASVAAIREMRTDIYLRRDHRIAVEAYLLDDRGREHVCSVLF
jgi:hypothetical protein